VKNQVRKAWVVHSVDPSNGKPRLKLMELIESQRAIMKSMLEKGCIGESIMEGNTKPVSTMDAEQAADNEANAMLAISIVIIIVSMFYVT
jgi:hypothetical protein